VINYDPKPRRYKMKIWQPTPEDQAILRRWREDARKRAYEKLRERDGR
jgi:hypothetical protein